MMSWLGRSPSSLFATRSLAGHLVRGALAASLLAWAFAQQGRHPMTALVAAVLALVAMRGCPACWTLGLIETLQQRRQPPPGP